MILTSSSRSTRSTPSNTCTIQQQMASTRILKSTTTTCTTPSNHHSNNSSHNRSSHNNNTCSRTLPNSKSHPGFPTTANTISATTNIRNNLNHHHHHYPSKRNASTAIDSSSTSCYLHNSNLIAPLSIDHLPKSSKHGNDNDPDAAADAASKSLLQKQVHDILKEIVPSFLVHWNIDHPRQLLIHSLEGGLSNHLLTVQPAEETNSNVNKKPRGGNGNVHDAPLPFRILIRIHGSDSHPEHDTQHMVQSSCTNNNSTQIVTNHSPSPHFELVNRSHENYISAVLSSKQMAPTYFGRFQNGRLEEFCENVRPLKYVEMKEPMFCREIARQLGKFHKICITKEHSAIVVPKGEIWKRVDDWLQMVHELYSVVAVHPDKHSTKETTIGTPVSECSGLSSCRIVPWIQEISREWQWLKHEIGPDSSHHDGDTGTTTSTMVQDLAIHYCREIVFAHMDCQSLNILTTCHTNDNDDNHHDDDDSDNFQANVQLIDFEYAGMNPRAADIGNTFCEFCDMNNLVPDYSKDYPTDSVQNMFLMSYMNENDAALAQKVREEMTLEDQETFFCTMRHEIGKHAMISHLGWAVWSLIQNKISSIEFDYIRYAEIRMDGYRLFKKRFGS